VREKPKCLPVQSLSQDNAFRVTIGEVSADEWLWAGALRRNCDDPWALCGALVTALIYALMEIYLLRGRREWQIP